MANPLPKPAVGSVFPTVPTDAHLTTINTARAARGLAGITMDRLHQLLSAKPGGSLSDFDFQAYAADVAVTPGIYRGH